MSDEKKQHGLSKWDDSYYVRTYIMAAKGYEEKRMYYEIGVTGMCWNKWKHSKPALQEAVNLGKEFVKSKKGNGDTLKDYVFKRLSPEHQALWNQIETLQRIPNGRLQADVLLSNAGETAMQHLFFHALAVNHYNKSEACRILNLSRDKIDEWAKSSETFIGLINQMQEIKKDLVEGYAFRAAEDGNVAMLTKLLESLCEDRGYGKKPAFQINNNVNIQQDSFINLDELPFEIKVQILEFYEQKDKQRQLDSTPQFPALSAPIPVEGVMVE